LSFSFCYRLFSFCVGIPGGGRGNIGQIVKLSRENNRWLVTLAAVNLYIYTFS
jgi:hypothetical protein